MTANDNYVYQRDTLVRLRWLAGIILALCALAYTKLPFSPVGMLFPRAHIPYERLTFLTWTCAMVFAITWPGWAAYALKRLPVLEDADLWPWQRDLVRYVLVLGSGALAAWSVWQLRSLPDHVFPYWLGFDRMGLVVKLIFLLPMLVLFDLARGVQDYWDNTQYALWDRMKWAIAASAAIAAALVLIPPYLLGALLLCRLLCAFTLPPSPLPLVTLVFPLVVLYREGWWPGWPLLLGLLFLLQAAWIAPPSSAAPAPPAPVQAPPAAVAPSPPPTVPAPEPPDIPAPVLHDHEAARAVLTHLAHSIDCENMEVRRRAVVALATVAVPEKPETVLRFLAPEFDAQTRLAALQAARILGTEAAMDAVSPLTSDADLAIRWRARQVVQHFQSAPALEEAAGQRNGTPRFRPEPEHQNTASPGESEPLVSIIS